jgi:EAL domain-containing protein (putative c-di-GMP-specific phosphodiesterase class I)
VLERPVSLRHLEIDVRGSIGVALFPANGDEPSVLLQRADVAMYEAKAAHAGVNLYDPDRDRNSPRRLALAAELGRAISDGMLEVYYQPKMSVNTREVLGAEALVRWHHPRHGLLLPDEFIPLAESTGLIHPLTAFVLDSGLRQAASWRRSGIDIGIAVNISARNLLDRDLPDKVSALLTEAGVPPAALTLEITEDSIMADPQRSLAVLGRLHANGVRLAIDDFGTGYSSLSYLKQLPVDEVKIDKSFVISMALDDSDATIVRSTIDLGHNLGLSVVAEGVETVEAFDRLRQGGCDVAQGYLFSRPVPAEAFERWVRVRRQEPRVAPLPAASSS